MLHWIKRQLIRSLSSSAKPRRRPNSLRCRLVVEELEQRLAPATLNLLNSSGLNANDIQVVGWYTGPYNSKANTSEYQLTSGGVFTAKTGNVTSFPLSDLASANYNLNLGTGALSSGDIVMEYISNGGTFTIPFSQVPDPNTPTVPYDFIEFSQNGTLSIDTSQVNQFGFPITLTDVQSSQSVGVAPGVTRDAIIQGYQNFTSGSSSFGNLVIPATTHDSNYTDLRIEAPSKVPGGASYPAGLASYFDSALKTLFNGTTPLKIGVNFIPGFSSTLTYTATPVTWEYDTADSTGPANTYVYVNSTSNKVLLPALTGGAVYNYQSSDGNQFWPALEFTQSGGYSGEAAGPFFVFAPWWQTNGYTAANDPLGGTPPTDAPSWIKTSLPAADQSSPGQQVFGASQIFADQGAGTSTGANAGQVVGLNTVYQNILAQLESQLDAALQRGVANLNYSTTKTTGGAYYTDDTQMWAGPVPYTTETQAHVPYYPAGPANNLYADALHNMQVTNLSGQTVYPFIDQKAYAISYDDVGNNASLLPTVPIGDTVTVTLDPWVPSPSSFVESAYAYLLNRPADPGGLASWTNLLTSLGNTAAARAQIVTDIGQSTEYLNDVVAALYQHYLNRAPDPGAQIWVSVLENGATIEQVTDGIVNSPEFFLDSGSTNNGYLTALYTSILDRAPDFGGFVSWIGQLNSGVSREAVAMGFLTSLEYRTDLVAGVGWTPAGGLATAGNYFQGYYLDFLGRQGELGGVAGWVLALQGGMTDQQVVAGILGSSEFYNNRV